MSGKTELRFVAGFETGRKPSWPVRHLPRRFAVIQESYRPDCTDMYFDETLWFRLIDFAHAFLPGQSPAIVDEERNTTPVDVFLAAWRQMAPDDRLPEGIELRDERGAIALFVQPVAWAQVGGPIPYHDSYTYEIYSYDDVSARVLDVLRADGGVARWVFGPVLKPGEI